MGSDAGFVPSRKHKSSPSLHPGINLNMHLKISQFSIQDEIVYNLTSGTGSSYFALIDCTFIYEHAE
jgi:hypothetical protein